MIARTALATVLNEKDILAIYSQTPSFHFSHHIIHFSINMSK